MLQDHSHLDLEQAGLGLKLTNLTNYLAHHLRALSNVTCMKLESCTGYLAGPLTYKGYQ